MEKAIELALSVGWQPKGFPLTEEPAEDIEVRVVEITEDDDDPFPIRFGNREYPEEGYVYSTDWEHIVLDPKFFQALGKACGWEGHDHWADNNPPKYYWHRFIDHLAEGKDANEFFKNLIK